ncbi:MAG TPA: divalent-cation tolerance protein CutA [Clostridia bacterium]|nr:divalent-cation tolerance protein CutA [Clostridia bacterium]
MKATARFAIALVTAPDLKTARRLAQAALQARLTACANLIPKLESHYTWQGKIETSSEVLLIFKTRATLLDRLQKLILAKHPYDTPEFIALPVTRGSKDYLNWIEQSTTPPAFKRGRSKPNLPA